MKNNKKGFTLIELLAVIVVLAILMLTAGTSVFNLISDARKNNFRNEFLSLLEAGALQAQMDMMNTGVLPDGWKCYTITDAKNGSLDTRWDNKAKYNGSVLVSDKAGNGQLKVFGWMASTQLAIETQDSTIIAKDVGNVDTSKDYTDCGGYSGGDLPTVTHAS